MARRLFLVIALVLALSLAFSLGNSVAQSKRSVDAAGAALCSDPANAATFQSSSGTTQVTICPSLVISGRQLHVIVHTRRFTAVRFQMQYPDGTPASASRLTDGQGLALFDFTVRYNPIDRYVRASFLVLVGRGGQLDMVSGTVTIGQGVPLGNSRLRVRPASADNTDTGGTWCPGDAASCVVHNNSQIEIRVDTDPGAQVNVTLFYPDNQSVPCTNNDLNSTTFASDTGIYRCELPIVFQARGKRGNNILHVVAQISSGNYSRPPLSQKLYLVSG